MQEQYKFPLVFMLRLCIVPTLESEDAEEHQKRTFYLMRLQAIMETAKAVGMVALVE